MSIRVTVSKPADADFLTILAKSIESWGMDRAYEYRLGLRTAIAMLGDHPDIGKRLPHLGPSVRRLIHESHIIVYERISDDEIEILRIVHGSRRLSRRVLVGQD